MTTPDDTLRERYRALLNRGATNCSVHDGLRLVGDIIDLATELNEPDGLHHAISIAQNIEKRIAAPVQNTELYYFIGNAWSELQRHRPAPDANLWDWDQPEAEQAILAYRTAINSEGFPHLRPKRQARILTNLANLLDHLGRFIEAIELWERALQNTPGFGMARGNRALGFRTYGVYLYDNAHKGLFLKTAYNELTNALTQEVEEHARSGFTALRDEIAELLTPEFLSRTTNLDEYSLGDSTEEQDYRKAMLASRLFLNPLNDLGPHAIAARDILHTPPIVVRISEGPYYQGFMNQLKQEFVAARYLYYEGITTRHPHYADRDVTLTDTLDYPSYGLGTEQVRAAYRLAYSLFDKIAFFLNHYLKLGIPEKSVSFRSIWYAQNNHKKGLRQEFLRYENLPLRGLYWLAKDLAPSDATVTRTLEPDAQYLKDIRDHLEHKYLKLHTEGFLGPAPTRATKPLRDTLALSMNRHTFEKKCLRILTLTRAALVYLALAIHREETLRAKKRPPDQKLGRITFHKISDRGKG